MRKLGFSREKDRFYGKDAGVAPHFNPAYTSQPLIYSMLVAVVMQLPASALAQTSKFECRPTDSVTERANKKLPPQPSLESILANPRIKRCKKTIPVIKRQLQSKNATVVDLQSSRNFKNSRIPNSINLPKHLVKTRNFLKARNLFVVGEGFSDDQLFGTCLELIDHGFQQVTVLEGGVQRWLRLLRPNISMDVESLLPVIKPRDAYIELDAKDWKIVALNKNMENELATLFPNREVVRFDAFQNGHQSSEDGKKYLFVGRDGSEYLNTKELLKGRGGISSFWLEGGVQGFSRFLHNHEVMLAKSQRGNVRRAGCGL